MAFTITFTMVDAYGRTTSKTFGNDRTLLADALTDAATFISEFESVSDLAVTKYDITAKGTSSNSAAAGANVDTGGTIHSVLADGSGYALKIPGIDATKVGADGSIDLTDADIVAYVALFKTGGHFTVSDGELIASTRYGELDR